MNNNISKNQEYWINRISDIKDVQYEKVEKVEKQLKDLYAEANKHLRNEMFIFYSKYSDNSGLSLVDTQKLLKKDELKEWKMSLEKYRELAHNMSNKQFLDEMYIRSRVSRLDALEAQMQAEIRLLGEKQNEATQSVLENIYEDTYEKTVNTIVDVSGMSIKYDKFDKIELESIVNKPFQNSNFSSRIWEDKANLIEQLNTTLAQHIILGKSPSQLADLFSKKLGTSYYKASRLLNTEAANITEQATLQGYKDTNIGEYEILATLDGRTSDICQEMNGKKFKINEAKTGINYPPFHPNCRTTTVPVVKDLEEFFEEKIQDREYKIETYNNYKAVDERKSIKKAIKSIPKNHRNLLNDTKFVIINDGNSRYDRKNDIIYILRGSNKNEVIHEIGHLVETRLNIYQNSEFIKILEENIDLYSMNSIKEDDTFNEVIEIVENSKFISRYQGRIYDCDMYGNSRIDYTNGKINVRALGEYFSEGYREYFQNPVHLKTKDAKLYNFIKELKK